MSQFEILSLVITFVCLFSFCTVFTILFRNYNLTAIKGIKEGKEDIELIDSVLLEENKKKNKKSKALRIVGRVTYYTLYACIFLFFGFSLVSRILDNSMLINDSGLVVIASSSMSKKYKDNTYLDEFDLNDQIQMYDIIGVSRYKDIKDVKLYDIIAFKANDGRTIVHRIISLKETDDGNIEVETKGDSNASKDTNALYDTSLKYEDIIGYYNHVNIPLLGSFVIFLQSNSGIITIVSIGYCVFMFDFYRSKLEKAILERTNLLIELIDYDPNEKEVNNYFQQELIYKGYKYIFNEGNFIKKELINDEEIINESNDKIYSKLVNKVGGDSLPNVSESSLNSCDLKEKSSKTQTFFQNLKDKLTFKKNKKEEVLDVNNLTEEVKEENKEDIILEEKIFVKDINDEEIKSLSKEELGSSDEYDDDRSLIEVIKDLINKNKK